MRAEVIVETKKVLGIEARVCGISASRNVIVDPVVIAADDAVVNGM